MIYQVDKVKQLKLVTGEEIICEIVEEDDDHIIVRNVLAINFTTLDDGSRMWTFKYYLCYQDDPDRYILIKSDKVVAVANPAKALINQYEVALDDMMEVEPSDPAEYMMGPEPDPFEGDSADSNVLTFPTTFH